MNKLCLFALVLLLVCPVQAKPSAKAKPSAQPKLPSPAYSITTIGILSGYSQSAAYGLNDNGGVVGALRTGTDTRPDHVFLWTHGRLRDLATIPSPYTPNHPYDISRVCINNHGLIVASFSVFFDGAYMGTRQEADIYNNGKWQRLPNLPGFTDTSAAGVNNHGEIALTTDSTSSTTHLDAPPYDPPHTALYQQGHLTDLGPGSASGLNNLGQVSGYVYKDAQGNPRSRFVNTQESVKVSALLLTAHLRTVLGEGMTTGISDTGTVIGITGGIPTSQGYSFRHTVPVQWQQGTVKRLDSEATSSAVPQAINAQGQIVGGPWLWQARRYNLSRLIPLRSGWKNLRAAVINKTGQIAGTGLFHGKTRAFLMTPIK